MRAGDCVAGCMLACTPVHQQVVSGNRKAFSSVHPIGGDFCGWEFDRINLRMIFRLSVAVVPTEKVYGKNRENLSTECGVGKGYNR
jgi:hypothetical protein